MVDLVARVVTLDSRKRRLGLVMNAHPEELAEIGQHFVRESHCLLLEADIWGNSLSALPQHPRVTVSLKESMVFAVRDDMLMVVRGLHLQIHGGHLHSCRCECSSEVFRDLPD